MLDALDECGPFDVQEELAILLKKKISMLPSNFRFLVTSRPESGIRSLFLAEAPSICEYFNLNLMSISSREDVIKFVCHEMKELREKRDWHVADDWPWDEKMKLFEKLQKEFLYGHQLQSNIFLGRDRVNLST